VDIAEIPTFFESEHYLTAHRPVVLSIETSLAYFNRTFVTDPFIASWYYRRLVEFFISCRETTDTLRRVDTPLPRIRQDSGQPTCQQAQQAGAYKSYFVSH
jgi:hypothetical protein